MPRRSVAVLVAVALAVIASAAAYVALHTAQQKAYKNATLTSVYVLTGVVPENESGAAASSLGLIKATRMPLQFVPPGAVTNLSDIRNRVAGSNLPRGEVVVAGMFVSLKAIPSVAAERVPRGDVAVSVSADQVHSVAGLIEPGDKVDILVNLAGRQETYLYQSVPVLAVGPTLVAAPGSATPGRTNAAPQARNVLTFAVTRDAAARIALASGSGGGVSGGIYLALEAPGNTAAPVPAITGANLVPSGPSAASTPTITGSNSAHPGSGTGGISEKSTSNALAP